MNVKIVDAPGYMDFEAELILKCLRADEVSVCVVGDPITKEVFVIESQYVEEA